MSRNSKQKAASKGGGRSPNSFYDAEAIEHFMALIGLQWQPGTVQRAEVRASYRLGPARPLIIDHTEVEFHCDERRAKVWVPEFQRTSFHQWFEVPYQEFEYTPGGSMLKIKAPARGNAPPYSVGLKPLA
ncbi:hypothetical protein ACLQ8Z_22560 [Bordetella hinzii]|uniref:N-acetyltransferase YedL n=1 Tax=Bordetella hinzii OH87 BAL007II TaxID=1331262 RepID=A0ABR4R4S0_9BORD|nr:hypothetical protein [Bordetella hinzii]KCB24500.1 hypothetical protein L544_1878 [Bordetella hinzii OH87 BAL007II]KCB39313.1 hypothetical protein L539_2187 [Bordetella hinzii 5132]